MKSVYFGKIQPEHVIIIDKELSRSSNESLFYLGPRPLGTCYGEIIEENNFSIYDLETNEFIGIGGLGPDGYNTIQHSLYICKDQRRKGYGAAVIIKILKEQFETTPAERSRIIVYESNEASLDLHQKMGYATEAALRNYIMIDGKLCSLYYLVVDKKEHEKAVKQYITMEKVKAENKDLAIARAAGDEALKKVIKDHDISEHQIERVLHGKDNNNSKSEN